MGRNKNKSNRSATRQQNTRTIASGGKGANRKKDTGLPTYFKQRKEALAREDERRAEGIASAEANAGDADMADAGIGRPSQFQSLSSASSAPGKEDVQQADAATAFERAATELALSGKRDSSVKAFMRDVKNVIENSDVILQVLDARDPLGSRSRQTELMAMGSGKKVVLIMNKIDLIPTSNLQAWLRYLRNDFPTLAFKASTQQQRTNLKQRGGPSDVSKQVFANDKLSSGSEAIGANALLQLLKNYARTAVKGSSVKHQLTVGVVGPPNVGKSSLINSLLRTRACAVASTPGWTKVIQPVVLEKGIKLLDCPGVVVSGGVQAELDGQMTEGDPAERSKDAIAWSLLRNTVKVELIDDPIAPVQAMLRRVDDEQLVELYNIEGGFNEGDAYDFLLRVALLRGKLAKGGVPDLEGAARIVLHDWNIGRIAFHTTPPSIHPSLLRSGQTTDAVDAKRDAQTEPHPKVPEPPTSATANELTTGSSLVTGFSEAFDLAALLGEADAEAMGVSKTAGQGQRDLIVARERVYASNTEERQADSIEEDSEEQHGDSESKARDGLHDVSHSSSMLGKRSRFAASDDSDSSDEEDTVDVKSLDDFDAHDRFQNNDEAVDGSFLHDASVKAPHSTPAAQSRQRRELERAMGEHEVALMARKRGDVRRLAKKQQKRIRKSGAGLVDALTSSMALRENGDGELDGDEQAEEIVGQRRGMFDLIAHEQDKQAQREQIVEQEEEL